MKVILTGEEYEALKARGDNMEQQVAKARKQYEAECMARAKTEAKLSREIMEALRLQYHPNASEVVLRLQGAINRFYTHVFEPEKLAQKDKQKPLDENQAAR